MEIGDIFVLNKSDREGADRFEQQLRAILELVPGRDGWTPPIVRTIATEDKGVDELAREVERFRAHAESAPNRRARQIAYWKEWLLRLLQARLIERVASAQMNAAEFEAVAKEVAARERDPYTAVSEILSRAGFG